MDELKKKNKDNVNKEREKAGIAKKEMERLVIVT